VIRALVEQTFDASKKYLVLAGLSTDSKPTTGIVTGSKFIEVDTGTNYAFDEVSGTWSAATITMQDIKDEIDSWLENNIDPDSGYALDRTLSLENAAAPADMVGDLKSALNAELDLDNLASSYTENSGFYIDGSSNVVYSGSGLVLIAIQIEANTRYLVKKSTKTITRVGTATTGTVTAGMSLTNVQRHNTASSDPIFITSGNNDTHMLIQLWGNADAAELKTVAANISSLIVCKTVQDQIDEINGIIEDVPTDIENLQSDTSELTNKVADTDNIIDMAFFYEKQYLNADNSKYGYYWQNGENIARTVQESGNYKSFDSFEIDAGKYYINVSPNAFCFAKYNDGTIVTIPTNRITDNLYTFNATQKATIYFTIDTRVITANAVMFSAVELPAEYMSGIYKTVYQFNNLFLDAENVRVVGKNQQYRTIQAACDAASAGDTILVMPGSYVENVSIWGKKLHIIGIDKKLCEIVDHSGHYDTPPVEMNIGTLANLTIRETGILADSSYPDGKYKTCYCLHIESGVNADGEEFLIENCNFINNVHACIGCGLYENLTVHFRNCSFHSTDEGSRTGYERATFYFHSNGGETINGQRMIVENCLIHAAKTYCVWAGKVGGSSGETKILFAGNTLYSDLVQNSPACVTATFDNEFSLDSSSSGNNVSTLNNSVPTNGKEMTLTVAASSSEQMTSIKTGMRNGRSYIYSALGGSSYSMGIIMCVTDNVVVNELSHALCNVTANASGTMRVWNRDSSNSHTYTIRVFEI
jgi:hypothetical protein